MRAKPAFIIIAHFIFQLQARAVLATKAYYAICQGDKTCATCKNELTHTYSVRKALINCLRGMKRKAHGAQEPRHIWKYVEVTSTAQCGDSPAQAINQRFLRNVNLGRQTCPLAPPPFNRHEISGLNRLHRSLAANIFNLSDQFRA